MLAYRRQNNDPNFECDVDTCTVASMTKTMMIWKHKSPFQREDEHEVIEEKEDFRMKKGDDNNTDNHVYHE